MGADVDRADREDDPGRLTISSVDHASGRRLSIVERTRGYERIAVGNVAGERDRRIPTCARTWIANVENVGFDQLAYANCARDRVERLGSYNSNCDGDRAKSNQSLDITKRIAARQRSPRRARRLLTAVISMKLSIASYLALSAALIVSPMPAGAGATEHHEVVIGPDFAYGALPAARSSPDAHQLITCYSGAGGDDGTFAMCAAQDAAEHLRACFSYDAAIVAAVRALDNESYVFFQWNKDGECVQINVYTSSVMKP